MKKHHVATKTLTGNQVNWNQVYYFSQVAAYGSLREAGRLLDLSPSTLSEHISQLEKDLKVELFHRHHRKLALTSEGARIFQYAKQMFETGLRLIDVVSPIPLGQYPVSVGLVPSFSLPLAYEIIRAYLGQERAVDVRLEHADHDELEKGLSEARYDFGFTNRALERRDISAQLVSSSRLGLYASSSLARRKAADLFTQLPLLVCSVGAAPKAMIQSSLEELGLAPRSVITSDFPSLIYELCHRGEGVAVFSEKAMEYFGSQGIKALGLGKARAGLPNLTERLFACWPVGAENSSAVQKLKTLLPVSEGKD